MYVIFPSNMLLRIPEESLEYNVHFFLKQNNRFAKNNKSKLYEK